MLWKKSVLKKFAKFPGKHPYQSLFLNKVADLRPETLLKRRLWYRCFPVNLGEFLETPLCKCFCLVNTVPINMELWLSLNVAWSQYHPNWSDLKWLSLTNPSNVHVKQLFTDVLQNRCSTPPVLLLIRILWLYPLVKRSYRVLTKYHDLVMMAPWSYFKLAWTEYVFWIFLLSKFGNHNLCWKKVIKFFQCHVIFSWWLHQYFSK